MVKVPGWERGVLRRRRPRPVVSAGVEALLLRAEQLAKAWLLALVAGGPRDEAAATLAGEVAPAGSGRPGHAESEGAIGGDRGTEGRDALWVGALRDEIMRAARASVPLALLLVELDDAERLAAVEPQGEASATFGRFAQAVRTS